MRTKTPATKFIKYMTEEEFNKVVGYAKQRHSASFLLCFKMMSYLALRVSEATTLKTINISQDFQNITYIDKKTKVIHNKQIPPFLQDDLKQYVKENKKRFKNYYLFPPNRASKNPHIQPTTFRYFFKDFRRKFGYDTPYHIAIDGKRLYRISTHTLKHFCLYKVFKASGNDIVFTQIFSGHKEMKHTIHYIMNMENRNKQGEILQRAFTN